MRFKTGHLAVAGRGEGAAGKGKKVGMAIALLVGVLVVAVAVALARYVDRNRHGEARMIERAHAAGFEEKQADIDGTRVNYAEGPDSGPALLLVHGQSMQWEDYASVLPGLAESYHVFAIDCFGHGESAHDPRLYTCATQGAFLVSFAERVIGEPYIVSGLSSGGIIAAWVAANDAERVAALVLEDPPFFRVTPEAMQQEPGCFAWLDGFEVVHAFLQQDEIDDLAVFYAAHSYLFSQFGGLQPKIAKWTAAERAAHEEGHLVLSWVPHDWVRGMYYYDDFDPQFSEAFYRGTWVSEGEQACMLESIACPTVYLKAETQYGKDGVLYAANSDEDALRVEKLVDDCETVRIKSGHDIHYEHPDGFVGAVDRAAAMAAMGDGAIIR